ncbi:MAG: hypothetical protein JWO15_3888 [Sphingomonadales bacterium]|nr:hypothetical protein [Sphingomonadales bacterium]
MTTLQPHHHGTTRGYDLKCRCDACRAAKSEANAAAREARRSGRVAVDEYELTGGRWVPADGIMRWVETPVEAPTPINLHALIACPTCRARVDQTCRTRSGHTTTPHQSRLAPRLCQCGALLDWRRRYCEPCAVEAVRVIKRESQRRIRAARKEAA